METLECMCCGKLGHAMCLRVPPVKAEEEDGTLNLYCPKCGEAGHHVDYVLNEYNEPSCLQPNFVAKSSRTKTQHKAQNKGGRSKGSGSGGNKSSSRQHSSATHSYVGSSGAKDSNWKKIKRKEGGGDCGGERTKVRYL